MNTIGQEHGRFYEERHYETDEPVTDEMLAMEPIKFLAKAGWHSIIYHSIMEMEGEEDSEFAVKHYEVATHLMYNYCANGCVTISRSGEKGYTITIEVNR